MAGDSGSRRFMRLWWVLAFTAGAVVGAASIILIGLQDTIWWIVGVCGSVIAITAIFERFGEGGSRLPRTSKRQWRPPQHSGQHGISRKEAKPKGPAGRGRLHAINGKKIVEPPPNEET
jgi:hypothetical protein